MDAVSTRILDRQVCSRMPQPIADAWQQFVVVSGASDYKRAELLVGSVSILLRTVLAYLLPDYLRGEPLPNEDEALRVLRRPTLGSLVDLVRRLAGHIGRRTDPPPFCPEACAWAVGADGRPTRGFRRLEQLVGLRNLSSSYTHGFAPVSDADATERVVGLLGPLREIWASLAWMQQVRPFRVVQTQVDRRRVFRARVQFLVGSNEIWKIEPSTAEWAVSAPLLESGVYLANRKGDAVLDLEPFLAVLPDARTRQERCFLFTSVPDGREIELVHDPSKATVRQAFPGADATLSFATWLERRTELQRHYDVGVPQSGLECPEIERLANDGELLGGRYRVLELVGRGGMAEVYRARDLELGRECAVKVLLGSACEDERFRRRFTREIGLLRRIQHPGVLPILDWGELASGRPYFTMPLAPGGNLRDVIERSGAPPATVAAWLRQLAASLVFLHEQRIVHRDIKPENILLSEDGRPLLADFGIALRVDSAEGRLTRTFERVGTLAYMAPELRDGSAVTDRADVFSLACVVHELLAGRSGGAPGAGIPAPFGPLLRRMGASRPDDRPSARELLDEAAALEQALAPAPPGIALPATGEASPAPFPPDPCPAAAADADADADAGPGPDADDRGAAEADGPAADPDGGHLTRELRAPAVVRALRSRWVAGLSFALGLALLVVAQNARIRWSGTATEDYLTVADRRAGATAELAAVRRHLARGEWSEAGPALEVAARAGARSDTVARLRGILDGELEAEQSVRLADAAAWAGRHAEAVRLLRSVPLWSRSAAPAGERLPRLRDQYRGAVTGRAARELRADRSAAAIEVFQHAARSTDDPLLASAFSAQAEAVAACDAALAAATAAEAEGDGEATIRALQRAIEADRQLGADRSTALESRIAGRIGPLLAGDGDPGRRAEAFAEAERLRQLALSGPGGAGVAAPLEKPFEVARLRGLADARGKLQKGARAEARAALAALATFFGPDAPERQLVQPPLLALLGEETVSGLLALDGAPLGDRVLAAARDRLGKDDLRGAKALLLFSRGLFEARDPRRAETEAFLRALADVPPP
jgi:tRNA A-37 threonylcarbamoyl transferase component Bud32